MIPTDDILTRDGKPVLLDLDLEIADGAPFGCAVLASELPDEAKEYLRTRANEMLEGMRMIAGDDEVPDDARDQILDKVETAREGYSDPLFLCWN